MAQRLLEAATTIGALGDHGGDDDHASALRGALEARQWLRRLSTEPSWNAELTPIVQESGDFIERLSAMVDERRGSTV